eukprot:1346227-Amorphochlora_amoeboformis.AAC.1
MDWGLGFGAKEAEKGFGISSRPLTGFDRGQMVSSSRGYLYVSLILPLCDVDRNARRTLTRRH